LNYYKHQSTPLFSRETVLAQDKVTFYQKLQRKIIDIMTPFFFKKSEINTQLHFANIKNVNAMLDIL